MAFRVFDRASALAGLVILSPLFALIALAIKLDDGGPILFSHTRMGKSLRKFQVLKFRSMRSDSAGGSPLTGPGDPRITRVGRWLRKYKLDELLQLVNVLKGEMQLVGVRPQHEKYVEIYRDAYEELLRDPPGITSLASLCFRNEEQFFHGPAYERQYIETILPAKLKISLKYSRDRNFLSDLEILFRTVLCFKPLSFMQANARSESATELLSRLISKNSSNLMDQDRADSQRPSPLART